MDEGLLIREESGAWHTPWDDASGDYAELPVPRSIAQSIERRLTFLSASMRRLLGLAAVVGREIEFDLWLVASEGDEEAVLSAAEQLAQRGLLVEANEVLGYRFAHDTIRRVVYENLSHVRRSRLHCQVASALEALHPNQVEAMARHFHLGQDWPKAIRYTLRAGERAQTVYANQQALDHYQLAEGWLSEGRMALRPSSGMGWSEDEITRWRADLAEKQGQIQALVCDYEAANAAYTYSSQAWRSLGDWRGAARVLNRLSFLYFTQSDYVQASHYAEAALDALPEGEGSTLSEVEGRMDLRATSLTYLGLSAWTQGHYDDALQPLEEALAFFEQLGSDSDGLARCLNSLALVHMGRGDLDAAEGYSVRSLMLRRQIGDRRGEAWCWHNQGQMAMMRGDLAAARRKVEAARAIFTEIQHPDGLDRCTQTLAEVAEAEEVAVQIRQVLVRLPRADAPTGRPLQDDEYVPVTWTVLTSEDSTIASAADRRRQQLLRLLQEAENQEAAPTVENLAGALQASRPTIKRDLAALRRAGYEVKTRGSRRG